MPPARSGHSPTSLPPWSGVLGELVPPGLRSRWRLALAGLVLLSTQLLTACVPAPPRVVLERVPVPAELLSCLPEPTIPEMAPLPEGEAKEELRGRLMVEMADAGADCRGKLARVRGIVAP